MKHIVLDILMCKMSHMKPLSFETFRNKSEIHTDLGMVSFSVLNFLDQYVICGLSCNRDDAFTNCFIILYFRQYDHSYSLCYQFDTQGPTCTRQVKPILFI